MLKISDAEYVGQFKVKSGSLRVSDPSYDKDTWCAGVIEEVKNGNWESYIKLDETSSRVSELISLYSDISNTTRKKDNWIEQSFEIGVDSGQCGIFDDEYYPNGKTGEFSDINSFYGKCCNMTTSELSGVLDFGVVSGSGFGDGSYTCYTIEDKNGVVGVKIIFIEDNEIPDEDYDDFKEYDDGDNNIDYYSDED